jgi:CRP/FNR family transcriptional regulator, cyclic AMP receptor protein
MELKLTNDAQAGAERVQRALAAVPFLRTLSPRRRAQLARRATTRRYAPGAVIVREGDTSMAVYVVLSGAVRIDREGRMGTGATASMGAAGTESVAAGLGMVFGELGVLHDRPRGETVVALEPTECALLAKWEFTALLYAEPRVAMDLMLQATQDVG